MKRSSPLWGSVSVLIGVVIAILALVRGAWLVPLLLLVFTAWGLWVVMFQLQPEQYFLFSVKQLHLHNGKPLMEVQLHNLI